ncbi:trehalose-6-phosphate hydrolase [Izhakiella capsodis]|uniref:Alpha,alpha-phosphotrehalase n=1 Tax=Izhakiella capsodis TaxID=1367852 RepID=A0A1I4Z1A2_9GAMM|nr:alpha,alpha-phosphotrehalase [Izhakiella capsodis]SFN44045.1 trehalose-6-phosphate hydrolase [Izhakiella capsodis]
MSNEIEWWKNGTIYQIYPKSFQDTTGSGTGDIIGIIKRLDYLQTLGVDALWLTPMYSSPQVDNGYDVADYYTIDPTYGTMPQFEQLIAETHRRGIRIVMDMVFNHTSTKHEWFLRSQDGDSEFRPFYIWRDPAENGGPPNNWRSKFGGSAWQWHEASGQYYLHLFSTEQADLNWEYPPVREALKSVCRFWAQKGVDGLRLDVVNLVSKQQDYLPDEIGDGRRFYTDGPRIHEFLHEFSRDVFKPLGLMTVGEMSSTRLEDCRRYAANDGSELSMTFNFHHLKVDYLNGNKWTDAAPDYVLLKQIFREWQQGMHGYAWNALFWCNHDQPRIVSRFGDEDSLRVPSAKMLAMVLHGMQGTPYIYQGEEIGMTNPGFTCIEQYRDVESLNMYAELKRAGRNDEDLLSILAGKSRDNSRTPMQWSADPQAGFSAGAPWIPVAHNADRINVERALTDHDSVFYLYQRLAQLRKSVSLLTEGDYQDLLPDHPFIWCYTRSAAGKTLRVLANLSGQEQAVPLAELSGKVLLHNYNEAARTGCLRPYECIWQLAE